MRKEFKMRKSQKKFEPKQFFSYNHDYKEVIVDDPDEDYEWAETPIKEEMSFHHSVKESVNLEEAKQEVEYNNYDSKLSVTHIKPENFNDSKYKDVCNTLHLLLRFVRSINRVK